MGVACGGDSHLETIWSTWVILTLVASPRACNGLSNHMWSPMKILFSSACGSICRAGSGFDYCSLSQHPVLLYAALSLIADNRNCVSSHPARSHTSCRPHPPSSLGLGVWCCFPRLKRKGDGVWWEKDTSNYSHMISPGLTVMTWEFPLWAQPSQVGGSVLTS